MQGASSRRINEGIPKALGYKNHTKKSAGTALHSFPPATYIPPQKVLAKHNLKITTDRRRT